VSQSDVLQETQGQSTQAQNGKIAVLYIAGSGRSGTTLLARLLGEVEGFVNIGEAARYLFDVNIRARDFPCGCGSALSSCSFWKDKIRAIPANLVQQASELVRIRKFPSLLMASGHSGNPEAYRPVLDALAEMYRAVARETGCRVIVDSSKNPANALLASLIPEVELHVLHVVRNPHRVVASWAKKKGYLKAHPRRKVIAWWWSFNLLSEALKLRARSYRLLRYEDFVREPEKRMQEITADVVGTAPAMPFLNGTEARVQLQHDLGGNPDKLGGGRINIVDTSDSAGGSRNWLVNLTTFPLLLRYQYLPSHRS
jgi:hypothetical protein